MRTGCHIRLRREIMKKRAVINVQSNDNACFAWSVIAAVHPPKLKVDRELLYPHYTIVLNLQNIEFSVTGKNIVPIRLSELKKERHVNLLYMQDLQNVGRFAWIKNLSRLVISQLSKHNGQKYICDRNKLQSHTLDCQEMNECAIRLPNENDKKLEFNNYNKKERLPFVVYGDLECYMQSYDPSKLSSYLIYFDVNNLYGWAMCQPLLYADFRWIDDVTSFDTSSIALDLPTGYILEVDLEYPQHLYDAHFDLLFCPTCDKPSGKREDKLLATRSVT
ncbi:hypothetical protein ACFW04_012775 [Cataglyphis niger]